MLPQLLSIAGPLAAYISLACLLYGVWRERQRFDWLALVPALAGLLASVVLLSPVHRLFFDEDIYVNIAGNLAAAPVNQATVWGGPDGIQVSTYYKEPPGFPVLLSLVFLVTGRSETIAFAVARVLYAAAIAAVFHLALVTLKSRAQALMAATLFGATPVCFWFSASTGTDLAAAVFSTMGMWGLVTGNGPLAAAGLALGAQTRMELLVFVPLVWISARISSRWKITTAALVVVEIVHVAWVLSLAPTLARAEGVPSAFSIDYVARNLSSNLSYLFDPLNSFVMLALVAAVFAMRHSSRKWKDESWRIGAGVFTLFCVYLLFYAGSFDLNPRYSIQLLAPMAVLAASLMQGRRAVLMLSVLLPLVNPADWLSGGAHASTDDHRIALEFRSRMTPNDLIVSAHPEIFLNHGARAMHATYASMHKESLEAEIARRRVWYHSGVRANSTGTEDSLADRWLKANLDLHLIESREIQGTGVALYDVRLKTGGNESANPEFRR